MKSLWFFTLILCLLSLSECAKILGILYMPGRSHYQAGSTLMKILAENGHEVTVVSPFKEKTLSKNYREVYMDGVLEKREKTRFNMFDFKINPFLAPFIFTSMMGPIVEELFNCTNFQKLMNSNEKFDLVIFEHFHSEALKYIAHHFNAPLIVYTPLETNEWVNPYQGNPFNPSYMPMLNLECNSDMTFIQRVSNTILYVLTELVRIAYYLPYQNIILHRYYPDAPELTEIGSNVSLVLVNTDPSVHEPLPRVPSIIGVGGFHIRKPKALPQDIQEILDNAKHGVIYFSMGSNVKSRDMPKEKLDMFIKTFAKFKETVLWKFEDENLPGKPDNVIIKSWLPQNDIFAHKNIKVFITHGGIFSTMEAVYHGLPILAIPIFGDQLPNAKRATESGYAQWLDFKTMSQEQLESSLRDLLTNPKYVQNVKIRSKIMKDKPMSPQDTVNFWVDYVIRHKGADHLRVASLKLKWYQYFLLDVVAFIIGVIVTSIYILKRILRAILSKKQKKIKIN